MDEDWDDPSPGAQGGTVSNCFMLVLPGVNWFSHRASVVPAMAERCSVEAGALLRSNQCTVIPAMETALMLPVSTHWLKC